MSRLTLLPGEQHEHAPEHNGYTPPRDSRRASNTKVLLPVILFLPTCGSTIWVGGLTFSAALILTLVAHELA